MRDEDPTLDRAAHVRSDLDQLEAALEDDGSLLVPVWRDQTLVHPKRGVARIELQRARDLLDVGELVWLGRLQQRACFGVDISKLDEPLSHPALTDAGEFEDLRAIGSSLSSFDAGLAAYARGLLYWHGTQRHCGVCGAPTAARDGGHMRQCRDEACATKHFPRTDPAVIVLVYDGDRCLLGRPRHAPPGMYSTLAGFVEPGEAPEQTVVREVEEETGVRVDRVRYFRSQPWPFPASLMLGFTARATHAEICIGDEELEDARWVTREELSDSRTLGFWVPGTFSLAGQLLNAFVEGTHAAPEPGEAVQSADATAAAVDEPAG